MHTVKKSKFDNFKNWNVMKFLNKYRTKCTCLDFYFFFFYLNRFETASNPVGLGTEKHWSELSLN